MRTMTILLLAALLCTATAQAQKVPAAVTTAFSKAYANVKSVKWDNEDGKYEASFKHNGQKMSVLYDQNGSVAETETDIAITDLPAKALEYARAKGSVKEAAKIVLADGTVQYEAEIKGADLLFDDKGNFIKSVPH